VTAVAFDTRFDRVRRSPAPLHPAAVNRGGDSALSRVPSDFYLGVLAVAHKP
jgi:hypothetical protein